MNDLRARFRKYRNRADLSQRALALKAGMSQNTINRIESGEGDSGQRLTVRQWKVLARAMDVDPAELLFGGDSNANEDEKIAA